MKWSYFVGASVVVGGALLKSGVPVLAIAAGVSLAALVNILRQRSRSARRALVAKIR